MTPARIERFADRLAEYSIQGGKMWVSQVSTDRVIFRGIDGLSLNVNDVRKLRDWLTSILP
jgi:hypothetical protein